MTDLGSYLEIDGRPAVRFKRTYSHPIEAVWAAVTEPDELVHWFPSALRMEPRVGGAIQFSGDPNLDDQRGTVLAYEPPHRFEFTWGTDELRLELESLGEGQCRLILINVLSAADTAARNASGWTGCLAELEKRLNGIASRGPHSEDCLPFLPLYDAHIAAGLPSGAEVPGLDR